jgi:hypothetical protein
MRHPLTRFLFSFFILAASCKQAEITPKSTIKETQMGICNPNMVTPEPANPNNYQIEQATGFDLLTNISDYVQKVIEARTDNGPTQ